MQRCSRSPAAWVRACSSFCWRWRSPRCSGRRAIRLPPSRSTSFGASAAPISRNLGSCQSTPCVASFTASSAQPAYRAALWRPAAGLSAFRRDSDWLHHAASGAQQIGGPLIHLVWMGGAYWLYLKGQTGVVLWLFVGWGVFVTVIDNILKPWLIGASIQMPLTLVILGVFGGFLSFGFLGLFIGPVLIAVAYALLVAWRAENHLGEGKRLAEDGKQGAPHGWRSQALHASIGRTKEIAGGKIGVQEPRCSRSDSRPCLRHHRVGAGCGGRLLQGADAEHPCRLRAGRRLRSLRPSGGAPHGQAFARNPDIVVQNMPGAGGLIAANTLYTRSPRDGSTIGHIQGPLSIRQIAGGRNVQYDMRNFGWLAARTTHPMCACSRRACP